jgi:MFS family permease
MRTTRVSAKPEPAFGTAHRQSLWRNPEFLKLWAGQTISTVGSGVTVSALPLTAVLMLGAGASEMGWLLAAESAPVLLVGMFAGVWVDRFRRRPLLIGADLGRAALLASIPFLAAVGALRIEHLFVLAAAVGALTVVFEVAYRSFVPDLVGPESVLEANSRLATVDAAAEITAPGLTGVLVQVISPATTILLDAFSFVGSALCIAGIRHTEPARSPTAQQDVWTDIGDGLRAVAGNPMLRAFAGWEALRNFFGMFIGALYVLYGLRELGLSPLLIGITIGLGGASNLLGTVIVERVTRRYGARRTMTGAILAGCLGPLLIAFAPDRPVAGFAVLLAGQALDLIHPLYDVNALTLRQTTTPEHLLGRVNATMHVIGRGAIPFGAVAGGMLGGAIGVRPTLLVAAVGITVGAIWLARWGLRGGLAATRSAASAPTSAARPFWPWPR